MTLTIITTIGIILFGMLVFFAFFMGLGNLGMGLSPRRSQQMMRYRILFQGAAVLLALFLSYWLWW